MRAAYILETGPPEVVKVGDLPRPEPGPGQVLVKVGATAINPINLYVRSGLVAMPMSFPFILHSDLAGTVEAVGPGASRFRVGDRVWGSNQGLLGRQGVSAEYAAVDEDWLYPVPSAVAFVGWTYVFLTSGWIYAGFGLLTLAAGVLVYGASARRFRQA